MVIHDVNCKEYLTFAILYIVRIINSRLRLVSLEGRKSFICCIKFGILPVSQIVRLQNT